ANPLEHRLLFERFLSERRTSLPDIDLDVESERRLEVYDAIIKRFGKERTAVTGMPETYRARHALRDTGLALGIPPQVVGDIAKSFPHIRARDIRGALAELPELRQLASQAAKFGPLWELAEGLDALPRGYAMHPCGVILSNASLLDRLPVQPTPAGYPMVQADKEDVEDLGLLKLDVLGVRMQSAMAYAVAEIRRTSGRALDLDNPDHVSLNDQQAFEMIRASDTVGLFQLESPGQQDLVARLQPRHMQDVVADISLFRPGPVSGGMPALYIAARHGAAPKYPHPDLEPVLNDTYGVVIWHEQIIAILATMTGCDRAAGDVARRALADPDRLPKVEAWFRRTAGERCYTKDVLDEVWETASSFGAYGFCRAHAVAFAVPALQSAYLKAHFPAYLYAGLLEHDPGMWPRLFPHLLCPALVVSRSGEITLRAVSRGSSRPCRSSLGGTRSVSRSCVPLRPGDPVSPNLRVCHEKRLAHSGRRPYSASHSSSSWREVWTRRPPVKRGSSVTSATHSTGGTKD
ncbi:DNA polymerase III subunit alpha, partial [Streptomyces sp. NPDC058255]